MQFKTPWSIDADSKLTVSTHKDICKIYRILIYFSLDSIFSLGPIQNSLVKNWNINNFHNPNKYLQINFYNYNINLLLSLTKQSQLSTCIYYRLGTLNSNTINSNFHFIWSFCEIFARFLLFHVYYFMVNSNTVNSNFYYIKVNLTGV